MLKRRLIPVLNILNGHIVRSEHFNVHQKIGNVVNQAARYNEWDVDELIYLDISRNRTYDLGRDDLKVKSYNNIEDIIKLISKVCFMPLAFGGGIKTLEDIDLRIKNGADKVIINTEAFRNPELIRIASEKYGRQAIIVSIDYRIIEDSPLVHTQFGQFNTGVSALQWAREAEALGAGEVFLNSIDRDGLATGFDISTINEFTKELKIPVISCGGAGDLDDFYEIFTKTNCSAVAAGNIFHFTERAYPRAKKELKKEGINVR
ncbi:MAG: imidazole glycerol phosphate synthase cyclase subunit [Bacteriovoracaceae bacterium]|nr:imidazole glycerol phosphate synthase cyclase subunit [Bacteriovoracaceae bacterium]